MKDEKEVLLEIKRQFNWPVDLFRYGFSDKVEFWNGKRIFSNLPESIQEKQGYSYEKIEYADKKLELISRIPWIKGILITGSVASYNAEKDDDIDIWFVVESKRIWLTRTLDFLLFVFSNKRRLASDGVDSHKINGKFCFNLYTTLDYKFESRTPSYAMQFIDAIPIYLESPHIYQIILRKNIWIKEIFPTWFKQVYMNSKGKVVRKPHCRILSSFLDILEYVAGVLMILKSEKKLVLRSDKVYRNIFTTWQTRRILSVYD